jgi:hypothetical protein
LGINGLDGRMEGEIFLRLARWSEVGLGGKLVEVEISKIIIAGQT